MATTPFNRSITCVMSTSRWRSTSWSRALPTWLISLATFVMSALCTSSMPISSLWNRASRSAPIITLALRRASLTRSSSIECERARTALAEFLARWRSSSAKSKRSAAARSFRRSSLSKAPEIPKGGGVPLHPPLAFGPSFDGLLARGLGIFGSLKRFGSASLSRSSTASSNGKTVMPVD